MQTHWTGTWMMRPQAKMGYLTDAIQERVLSFSHKHKDKNVCGCTLSSRVLV